ncbi:branched-chain amino acid ABC transporter substrate-binding protein [Pasteuria penetrans]|uniref:branched-chain amino acid ABC transporter substrate-binding protein n=1 Tax=Pasteuria penetrans TaxID=86005 RepID=UPI000FB63653|nr:branched-chain amino acid ABC transporter substrate-binding protein [Pasteuria penetrans]
MVKRTLVFALILAACLLSSRGLFLQQDRTKTIQIGLQAPLSGPSSAMGTMSLNGTRLAVMDARDEFKNDLGLNLSLTSMDDESRAAKGISNAVRLCSENPSVGSVIGHYNTGVAIAASGAYKRCDLALVSPHNTGDELTKLHNPTINRVCARENEMAEALAHIAYRYREMRKIGVLHDKTAYGAGLADSFAKHFTALGGQVTNIEAITIGEKDFSGPVNSLLRWNPDGIFFGGLYAEFSLLYKQARAKGFNGNFFAGEAIDSPKTLEMIGESIHDVYMTTLTGDIESTPGGTEWSKRFFQTFHISPDATAFDAYLAASYSLHVIYQLFHDPTFRARYAAGEEEVRSPLNRDGYPNRKLIMRAIRNAPLYTSPLGARVQLDQKGDNRYADVYIRSITSQYPAKILGRYDKEQKVLLPVNKMASPRAMGSPGDPT